MPRTTMDWRAHRGARALKRLTDIEASINMLADDDLLDFADIFLGTVPTVLGDMASAELAKRNLSL